MDLGLTQTLFLIGAIVAVVIEFVVAAGIVIAALAAARAAFNSAQLVTGLATRLDKMQAQLEHVSAADLTQLSIEQNWALFDRRNDLPPAFPSWVDLSDEGWAWRVLHLNRLDLLRLAYDDYNRRSIDQRELDAQVSKAKAWFRNLWPLNAEPDYREGREALRQLLRPEEGYPKAFRDWLVERQLIPPDLMSD